MSSWTCKWTYLAYALLVTFTFVFAWRSRVWEVGGAPNADATWRSSHLWRSIFPPVNSGCQGSGVQLGSASTGDELVSNRCRMNADFVDSQPSLVDVGHFRGASLIGCGPIPGRFRADSGPMLADFGAILVDVYRCRANVGQSGEAFSAGNGLPDHLALRGRLLLSSRVFWAHKALHALWILTSGARGSEPPLQPNSELRYPGRVAGFCSP